MQTVKLNLIPGSVMPVVNVSQYDVKRQFALSVYEGATAYDLTGKSVEIRGTKPDGNGFAYDAQDGVVSVSGNTVTISTTQQMTAVGGQTMAELRIKSGTTILGTINFVLDVEHSALSDDTPISETEIPVIERDFRAALEEAQEAAETSTTKAGEASTSATNAAGSATRAAADALKAEGYAVGKQNGSPVESESPYYHNNAEYYARHAGEQAYNASQSATAAGNSATAAAGDSLEAEGWATGEQNGTPVGPDSPYYHNNAAYYAQEAGQHASGGIIFKGSLAFADLPTVGMASGDEYNITDDFTTDSRFIEGAGLSVKAGTNIAWVAGNVNKWDILATGGGGADALDDLTDVEFTSPAEGDLLQRNGSGKWVNSAKIPQKVAGLQKTGCVNRLPNTGISEVVNGVTWTVVKDANGNVTEVTATGATGANASSFYTGTTNIGSGIYKLTGCPAGGGDDTYYMHPKVNGSWSNDRYEYGDGILVNGSVENCALTIAPNYTISGTLRFKPMLSDDLSATYDDYQPYSMTNRELTEAVTVLDKRAPLYKAGASTFVGLTGDSVTTHLPTILDNIDISNYSNGQFAVLAGGGVTYTGVFFKYSDDYWTFLSCGYGTAGKIMTFTKSNNIKTVNAFGSKIQTDTVDL